MVRPNEVRGPTSALTEFLRESGITPTTVASRARTANNSTGQPTAGPSNNDQATSGNGRRRTRTAQPPNGYTSDQLDQSEGEMPASKKRKMSKTELLKLKAKAKANAKTNKTGNDDGDYVDEDEDIYTALSKSMYQSTRPPVGSFENCAKCQQQFTVTKYTIAVVPPPGFLCHQCAKSYGSDPFKKPAPPRKRRAPGDKRTVVNFVERRFPTLVSMCIQIISRHIGDVEALGDIGSINMDEIAKSLSKNRSLTAENAPLFYNIENTTLSLYDVTNLTPPSLCALASLNPNLTSLRLDYCGRIDDSVLNAWCTSIPHLKYLELLGPFLIHPPAWQAFFKSHPKLERFLITQSPRFDLNSVNTLVSTCKNLKELRLKEVGQMSDEFLEALGNVKGGLTYLDLSYPGRPDALSEMALITLLERVGATIVHLDLSGNKNLTDQFLSEGITPHIHCLENLVLANLDELTDNGVGNFFDSWANLGSNPALKSLDLSRNHELSSAALNGVLKHSGSRLTSLNINGWKSTSNDSLSRIPQQAKHLVKIDFGFCQGVNDFSIKELLDGCDSLKEIKCWGCNGVTVACPRKKNLNIIGVQL